MNTENVLLNVCIYVDLMQNSCLYSTKKTKMEGERGIEETEKGTDIGAIYFPPLYF